jgi:hypothetical protein
MEQIKDSRISQSMRKKEQNKKNETEKRLPCGSLLGSVGVVLGMLVQPPGGRCGCVGAACLGGTSRSPAPLEERIRRLMRKRKHVKRTPGSGGQKNKAEKRFQDQAVAAERRTSGSGGQKNGVEKRFLDQVVNAEKKMKQ